MCILFFNARPRPKEDEFALVLINNRDELYSRPTETSHFWSECPDVLAGRDAALGPQGGTWLGMTTGGKIGVLLNVLQPKCEEKHGAKSRGHLVSDFLRTDVTSKTYLAGLTKERHLYNNFNLVTIETRPSLDDFDIGHYHNITDDPPHFLSPGFHGVGNCLPTKLWRKIPYGRQKFEEVCQKYPKVDTKEQLVTSLIDLLNDDTRHFPDSQMERQGPDKGDAYLELLSALCVKIPDVNYGTRTNTVILIDGLGNVDYVERTMEEPIDARNPRWIVHRHKFALKNRNLEGVHDNQ